MSQCDLFIQEGARLGRTPAEVVSMCDITFSCVSDPKAARDVSNSLSNCCHVRHLIFVFNSVFFFVFLQLVLGPSGVLQGIRPGKCYVEMSTVDPETITELSQVHSNNIRNVLKHQFI